MTVSGTGRAAASGAQGPLAERARRIRVAVIRAVSAAGSSHIGSAFSCVDILTALYFSVLKVDPQQPRLPERDRFVMSKAHAGIALYATLAQRGYFAEDLLDSYYVDGGKLAGHADAHGALGVEVSAGSLGHGLAIGTGMALRSQRAGLGWRTYVLMSDGECDEGSVWEAALLAGHLHLGGLTAIIDYNGLQGMGRTDDVVTLEPLADKWRAFGWTVSEVDGHDFDALVSALDRRSDRPTVVIARTVKGRGVSFMENDVLWHYRTPKGEELERALTELAG